jgi:predicted ABC-type ATPase
VPEARIHERYDRGRENLIRLLPSLDALRVYDNRVERDSKTGPAPEPLEILQMEGGILRRTSELTAVPDRVRPVLVAVLQTYRS